MSRPQNAFLQSLPEASYRALAEELTAVELPQNEHLHRAGDRVHWVHFCETALVSMLSVNSDGQTVETSMAGNEGAAGVLEVCGSGEAAVDAAVQINGRAWRASAKHVRALVETDREFSARIWRLIEFQIAESRQSALCNAMHLVERRFARWLLESTDRSGGRNPLPMTQEFLASMLGVQRTTVTAFAAQLQRTGLVEYRRGKIDLLDAEGLAERACECREATREQRVRLGLYLPGVLG